MGFGALSGVGGIAIFESGARYLEVGSERVHLKFWRVTIRGCEALRRKFATGASAGSLQGFCGVSAGLCRGPRDFPRDPILVILGTAGVKRRFRKCGFSAEPEELEKSIRDGGGQRRKINPESLGPTFSLCRRAGIDAASVKAQCSFRKCTPHPKYN